MRTVQRGCPFLEQQIWDTRVRVPYGCFPSQKGKSQAGTVWDPAREGHLGWVMTLCIAAGGRKAPFTFPPPQRVPPPAAGGIGSPGNEAKQFTVWACSSQMCGCQNPNLLSHSCLGQKKKNTECSLAANSSFLPRWLPVSGKDPLLRSFAPRSCPPGALPPPPGLCRSFLFPADSLRRVGQVTVTVQPQ